ncbi:MAG: tripartite tricarboxylate transporter TctB family protein, partial [Angelakisella sp.]
ENEAGSNGQAKDKKIPWNIPLLLTIALLVGYFLLIETVGYVVLTAAYLFCQMTILLPDGAVKNKKYLIPIVLTSVLIPSGIYFVFYRIFMIFLPAGILG